MGRDCGIGPWERSAKGEAVAIRVLIVDDNAALRGAVRALLGGTEGFEVVGEADDGPAGVSRAISLRPDVVLMDVDLPTQNGIEAAREIGNHLPTSRTLLFTGGTLEEGDCRRAGAVGVLPKTARSDELIAAIRRAVAPSAAAGSVSAGIPRLTLASTRPAGEVVEAAAVESPAVTAASPAARRGTSVRALSGVVVELSDLLVDASALIADLAEDGAPPSPKALRQLPALLQSVARAEQRLAHALLDEAALLDATEDAPNEPPPD